MKPMSVFRPRLNYRRVGYFCFRGARILGFWWLFIVILEVLSH